MRSIPIRRALVVVALGLTIVPTGRVGAGSGLPDRPDAFDGSAAARGGSAYAPIADGDRRWSAGNVAHQIRVDFSEEGVRVRPLSSSPPFWTWGISLSRFGPPDDWRASGHPLLRARDDRVEYQRGELVEWFRNGPRGIEHGLEIPGSAGPALLRFDFALSGSLTPKVSEDGQTVVFRDAAGAPVLAYLDLRGLDAEGREVDARWERIERTDDPGQMLRLTLNGSDHAGPLSLLGRLVTPKGASKNAGIAAPGTGVGILAAASNDACAAAEVIPGAGPFPYLSPLIDITDATTDGDPPAPSCQADVSRSVWFAFNPSSTAAYTFSVCSDAPSATTVEDTVLALYSATGICSGLAEVGGGCSDDACGATALQSSIDGITLTAGRTYYIVAWTYGTTAPPPGAGSLQLRVVQHIPPGPAPANDLCENAEPIPAAGPFPYLTAVTADISGATTTGDPPVPSCQPNVSRSVWYTFTPAVAGRYTFSLCAGAPTGSTVDDTVLAIYTAMAACSGFLEASGGCDDDSCAGEAAQSVLSGVGLAAGTRYYVVAWQYGTTAPAPGNVSIQVRVTRESSPPNDTCVAAAVLPLNVPVSGTTAAAFDDTRVPSGSGCFAGLGQTASTAIGGDVAYRFTPSEGGRYSFRLSGYDSARNAVLYVSSDCPAGGAHAPVAGCLGAANRTTASPEEVACLQFAPGQTVYVYVDEDAATSGSAFTIEANRCAMESEPNDVPVQAGELVCGMEGSITPAGDADFFALGIPESGSRVFAMADGAAGNSTDFDLRVTTGADTLEYDDFNNDVPFGSASPNVSGARLGGVASYLRVSHYSPAAQAEPYRLYASVQPSAGHATPEVEPNDTIVSATGGANEYYSGILSAAGDADLFSFSASAAELIQIGLDLDPTRDNTSFNGSLALLDAAGGTLLVVNDPSSSASNLPGSGSLTATVPFAAGEAMVYRMRVTGTYYVKVAGSSGIPADYLLSVSHDCRVGPPADVAVTQNDAPDPAPTAGTVTYSIIVRNLSSHPASVVTLRDQLPAGATLLSSQPSQGTCSGTGPVVCHLGNLEAGASATVSVGIVTPATPGTIMNSVRVASAVIDPFPENDASAAITTVGLVDGDGDGVLDGIDCAPADASAWAVPGEAIGPAVSAAGGVTVLQWSAPTMPGGTTVRFDLLRSVAPGSFQAPTCLAADTTAGSANDGESPGRIFYYLVRSRNICGGNLGTESDGTPRTAGSCP